MKSIKVTRFSTVFLIAALILVALITRFYGLSLKPIHFDESINAWFVQKMNLEGFYKYDPQNYHGPLYFYLLQFFQRMFGESLTVMRALPSLFSFFSVLLFAFGALPQRRVSLWMAAFIVFSPAFIFFGRSGIHESAFVFFQLIFMVGLLRYIRQESANANALAALLVGLCGMALLKETFVITLASSAIALFSLGQGSTKKILGFSRLRQSWNKKTTALALILLLFFVQIYSGFFKNPQGLLDFSKAFFPWIQTGVDGQGHNKPFTYWLEVLIYGEPLALMGVLFALAGLRSKHLEYRFISVFSLVQLLVYSAVPYKTVWCLLSIVWGFYLVLAYVFGELLGERAKRSILFATFYILGFNIYSIYQSSFKEPLDYSHPFFYVNSTYELERLHQYIKVSANENPLILTEPIQIGVKEQWPWPWLLKDYKIGTYQLCGTALISRASIYFCDPEDHLRIEKSLQDKFWRVKLQFRQEGGEVYIYLRQDLFKQPPFETVEISGPVKE